MTTKIKNGSIKLPKEFEASWRNAEVYMKSDGDTLFIKKLQPPTLQEMRPKLKKLGKIITPRDVKRAIADIRSNNK